MAGETMPRKSGPIDDPVIAELLKRKAESAKDIAKKIKERRVQLGRRASGTNESGCSC